MPLDVSLNLLALVLSGAMAAMLAAVLRWFASPTAHAHYRHWAAAWTAQAAYYLIGAVSFGLGVLSPVGPVPRFLLSSATQAANVLAASLLIIGTIGYVNRRSFSRRQLQQLFLLAIVVGVAVAAISLVEDLRVARQIFRGAISATSFLACGFIIRRHRDRLDRPGRFLSLTMIGFGLVQVHYAAYACLTMVGIRPPYALSPLTIIDVGWITAIVTTMVALAFADQQQAGEAALRERETEFRQMIEFSSDLVLILDPDLVLRYASPSTTRVLGWGDADLATSIATRVHPDDIGELTHRTMPDGKDGTTAFGLRLRHRDGNWVHVEAVATRAISDMRGAQLIINARDISERERLEATLRESQKLESIGRLAGGVAHDLNNILTIIGGNAELGLSDTSSTAREQFVDIAHATRRATDLTRQLLTFARRQVVAPRRIDIWDAVQSTTHMVARLLPSSIELRIRPPAAPHHVVADAGQMEQVIMNLLVNARDAIQGSGTIDVELGVVEMAVTPEPGAAPGTYVTVTVRDTGAGIPDHVRPHLFEPFFTTKTLGEGTGLGLATSYGIVRQAGGFIAVESVVGQGSTFRIHLPMATATPVETVIPQQPAVHTHNETVLVVDDEPAVRTLMVSTLRRLGYHVLSAQDGVDALAVLRTTPVDVLVTDVIMPHMSGVELVHAVRQTYPDIGVVMVSGYPGDINFLDALPARTSFLQKPFHGAELALHVERALDGHARSTTNLSAQSPSAYRA